MHCSIGDPEAVAQRCSVKKVFLKILINSQESTCARVFFFDKVASLRPVTLLKKETLAQVFSCEFIKIFKNTFFNRTPPMAVSGDLPSVCYEHKIF